MSRELFFLRSSEQKIVTSMLRYAYRLDETDQTLQDVKELAIYEEFYGFTAKDLGLYALVEGEIAGAIWSRRLHSEHNSTAFLNDNIPVLSVAVVPKFRNRGVGTFMMEQFLQETAPLYEGLSVNVLSNSQVINFYKKFGFVIVEDLQRKSVVDGKEISIMKKKLEKKELIRPSDGYDPTRWMD